ncbi:MAG: DUF4340 domain-containing protein [Nannocystaceae bacterium]
MLAAISLGAAISMRPIQVEPRPYEDTGDLLFPDFKDPSTATSLEVVSWDEKQARLVSFKVEQKAGRWVIPSHNDYPADGTERMGKAAASFIDVRRDLVQTDRVEDQAALGVEDPDKADGTGRGQRITIKDQSGATLVDIIVGKQVENKQGYRYVRFPDQKRVYVSKLELDISTEFTDWIEKDLLHVERDSIYRLISDAYHVDEAAGKVVDTDPLLVELVPKPDAPDQTEWQVGPDINIPAGKVLDTTKVSQVLGAIDRLTIVGVRPRPAQLTLQALQSKGFFVTQSGQRLYGNEGEVRAVCDDGVVYVLYFGEITFDSGLALTAGAEGEGAKAAAEGDDKKGSRYMFVDVAYDPGSDRKPPVEGGEGPEGAKRAESLQKRFDQWFYVITDDSFKQMHKAKAEFLKDAPAAG